MKKTGEQWISTNLITTISLLAGSDSLNKPKHFLVLNFMARARTIYRYCNDY